MAAPAASHVKLPNDAPNAGFKQMRTQTRLVGAETVHEHFFVPVSPRAKLGIYYYSPALLSVQAAAQDAVASGSFWLQNPSGSGRNLVLREIALAFTNASAAVAATGPRIIASVFTFTGTASGASVAAVKSGRIASEPNPVAFLRTAVTGMTVTLGATLASFLVPTVLVSNSVYVTVPQVWPNSKDPFEDDGLVIPPLSGLVLWQPDAGTASDPRRFVANVITEEIDV
jgi:hypothetical protein